MILLLVLLCFVTLAAAFAVYLVKRDRGEREPVKALWAAFGFGLVGLPVAAVLEAFLLPGLAVDQLTLKADLGTVALIAIGVGIIEELAKALPLIWFIYKKRYFNEHTDGVIYFALAGLGFGLPENIMYTLQNGTKVGLARLVMTPLFHAATTSLIGYAVIKHKLDKSPIVSMLSMILLAIVLHGLYDFGLLSGRGGLVLLSVITTFGLTISLFVLFVNAQGLDQLSGLSAVGNNSFCRSCGHPNPKHLLYCSHCGKRA
jgi:RsiW-degrading membrane proteinase PrsW (M82 family)